MGSSYQKFAKNIGVIGLTNLSVILSGLILLPLLTKTLGAYDYGLWVQAQVTIGLVTTIAMLGLPHAMIRFLAAEKNREEIQEGFYSVLCLVFLTSLAVSLILIIYPDFLARILFDGATDIVRIVGVIILIWSIERVCLVFLRTFQQMKTYSGFIIIRTFGEIGLIWYMIVTAGLGIFGAVISILIIRGIIFLLLFGRIISKTGIKLPNFSRLKEYLRFSLPTIPSFISLWAIDSCDRYVIAYLLGVTFVGFYAPGYAVGSLIVVVNGALGFVLIPTLSKLYDESRIEELKNHLRYSLKYFLMLAIPFVFGASLLSKQILLILSTPEIASEAYLVAPIVALSISIFGAGSIISIILDLAKKTVTEGVIFASSALVNLVLNILLIPHIGILGAAIATLIACIFVLALMAYFSLKHLTFPMEWKVLFKSVIAALVMALAIFVANPAGISQVIIWIIAGAAIYLCVLVLLRGFKMDELRFLRGLFQRAP